jgi:hypothetical protein
VTRLGLSVLLLTFATPVLAAKAPGAPAPACGDKAVPLAVGNTWTYRSGGEQIQIKITDVQPGKDWNGKAATVISADETLGARVIKTTYTCSTAGILFPPDSFFFSGEPGGGVGDTFTVTGREAQSLLPDGGLVADANWIETVKADVTRSDSSGVGAKHDPAKVEIELHVQVHPSGGVAVPTGNYPRALKVGFELRGRGVIGEAKVEIPIKRPGAFYIQPGIGIVKIEDVFDKNWELTETNVTGK